MRLTGLKRLLWLGAASMAGCTSGHLPPDASGAQGPAPVAPGYVAKGYLDADFDPERVAPAVSADVDPHAHHKHAPEKPPPEKPSPEKSGAPHPSAPQGDGHTPEAPHSSDP